MTTFIPIWIYNVDLTNDFQRHNLTDLQVVEIYKSIINGFENLYPAPVPTEAQRIADLAFFRAGVVLGPSGFPIQVIYKESSKVETLKRCKNPAGMVDAMSLLESKLTGNHALS